MLNAIGESIPATKNLIQPGQTNQVFMSNLDQAGKMLLQDYYNSFRTYTGNTSGQTTQTTPSGLPTTITPNLQATNQTPPLPSSPQSGWFSTGMGANPLAGNLLK